MYEGDRHDEREAEVKQRSQEIEDATLPVEPFELVQSEPPQTPLDQLKQDVNDSLELMADKILQLENEIAELRQRPFEGVLSEEDVLKVVGVILGNDKLADFLGQKLRDRFKDRVKVNFEIG